MIHFGEREGAQGKGYAEGAWAAGASGLMYFAGEGVTAFDPRQVRSARTIRGSSSPRSKSFTGRWRRSGCDPGSPLERTIDSQEEVTLGPDATVFSVEMAPLHYVDPPATG